TVPKVHAAGTETMKIAFIGCGGRGSGAVRQALNADPAATLWAVADVFPEKTQKSLDSLRNEMPEKVSVSDDRSFSGFDAYKNAMDSLNPGDVVLLTTPPAFRPLHYAYAVEKGLHVFAEKPVAVDIPSLKWLQESNKIAAEKNLKVGIGLNNRHYFRTAETVEAIHDGNLGDIMSMWVYRMHTLGSFRPRGQTPLESQLRSPYSFNWTSGGFIVDALIHNLDICCWAKKSLPVAAQGQGGRITRTDKDQKINVAAVEYFFEDGTRMMMQAKLFANTWQSFQATVQGTKGYAVLGEGIKHPGIYTAFNAREFQPRNPSWTASSPQNDSYQTEHNRLFKAIRDNQSWNEMGTGMNATFVAILGRMAVDTGKYVTEDAAWASTVELAPNIAELSFDKPAPVMPDADGNYPQAIPGVTEI
ncbi:MAG: Gfo/Idh/MocA family oxidoreductase, partial [Planctomycetaceae bacterium]|nr:Gfo/Idh/MocA family oxidoreductase [Planctomycetaceae bacterium]